MTKDPFHLSGTALADILDDRLERFNSARCAVAATLGARLIRADRHAATASIGFTLGDGFLHGGNSIQGGLMATMLDFTMAMAALARTPTGQSVGTSNLSVEFWRPAFPGDFTCHARLTRTGKRLVFSRAELCNDSDKVLAVGTTTNLVVPPASAAPEQSDKGD
ncbi:PaaI family thioesterase [Yunchengibacter salinarum]|uniref:PaaI family thioesterase n=1 Tax=Yunchengibacter salinarum TaxID=3133399 RepID=UPI0035B5C578